MSANTLMDAAIRRVLKYLSQHPNRVAELTQRLVSFDTAFLGPGTPPREEKDCQQWIYQVLTDLGLTVDLWEPDPREVRSHPMYRPGLDWRERPICVGVLQGAGNGRSLILNGHIDTVSVGPIEQWTKDPWAGEVEGDRLYGRGSCDMKGGIAAILAVVEALVRSGVRLRGDAIVQTVTDEETTGMGTVAVIQRGYRADACVIPEPSDFNVWVAYRGILTATIRTRGRAAHAEIPQPHWSIGGGVNAIDVMRRVLNSLDALNEEWATRPDKLHPLLAPPRVVLTRIEGGEDVSSLPAACEAYVDLTYLPADRDERGYGSRVREEFEAHLRAWAAADGWLREHPPEITWLEDYPPAEAPQQHPLLEVLCAAAEAEGLGTRVAGLNSWADAASYLLAGVPAYCYGPGSIYRAHTVDEWVSVTELQRLTRVLARMVIGWCGVESLAEPEEGNHAHL
jgi:acetylornithine deacetylase